MPQNSHFSLGDTHKSTVPWVFEEGDNRTVYEGLPIQSGTVRGVSRRVTLSWELKNKWALSKLRKVGQSIRGKGNSKCKNKEKSFSVDWINHTMPARRAAVGVHAFISAFFCRLGLSFNSISAVDNGTLANTPHLRELHLDNNKLIKVPGGLAEHKYIQVRPHHEMWGVSRERTSLLGC